MPTEETVTSAIRMNVRVAMVRRGLTQADLAAAVGVNQQGVSKRMNGQVTWSIHELISAARALNAPLSDLIPDSLVNETP